MGRNRIYGDDSSCYSYRAPTILDKAIRVIAKKRGINHTRMTYELLMEHPDVISQLKKVNHEQRVRTRKADSVRPK